MGKPSSTVGVACVFLECVRDEGATDQFVVSGKVAEITNSISPDNTLFPLRFDAKLFVRDVHDETCNDDTYPAIQNLPTRWLSPYL